MVIMDNCKKEWWESEINEKFQIMTGVVFYVLFALGLTRLVVQFFGLYDHELMDAFDLLFPILLTVASMKFSWISPYFKIVCALTIAESLNLACMELGQRFSQGDNLILLMSALIVLFCLQLPFLHSKMATTLLIIKFQYQWYLRHILEGTLDTHKISIPIYSIVVFIFFYQYYKHFVMKYSYDCFEANKNLKISQKEISSLLKLIPGGLLVISRDLTILHFNPNVLDILQAQSSNLSEKLQDIQYIPNKKVNNLTQDTYVFSDIRECFSQSQNCEFVLGVTPGNFEWRAKHISWMHKSAVVITIQNIDKITRLEKQSNEILFKNLLLSSASHELRNPTITISEYSSNIIERDQDLSPSTREDLRVISNNSKLLLSLIGDILDFSTMVSGDFSVQKKICDPQELIEDCCDIFKHQIAKKGLEFEKRIDPDLPLSIYTDPVRLKQILINLISNAKKFTMRGCIEVSAIHTFDDKLRMSVRDTGVGIKAEDREKIFDPWKTDKDPFLNYGGCGLGLTISNILSYKLGGSPIKVQSVVGQGSVFSFKIYTRDVQEIDVVPSSDSELSALEYHNIPVSFPSSEISPSQVLIVDDEPSIRRIIGTILDKAHVCWSEVGSGEEAIEAIRKHDLMGKAFGVVIMDIEMAGMDGWETTIKIREISEISKQPFVIGHSANHSEAYSEKCYRSGIDLTLRKPAKAKELIGIITSLVK